MAVEGRGDYRQRLVRHKMSRENRAANKATRESAFSKRRSLKEAYLSQIKEEAQTAGKIVLSEKSLLKPLEGLANVPKYLTTALAPDPKDKYAPLPYSGLDKRTQKVMSAVLDPTEKKEWEAAQITSMLDVVMGGTGVIGSTSRRSPETYRAEVESIAESFAKEAQTLAPWSVTAASRAKKQIAKGRLPTVSRAIAEQVRNRILPEGTSNPDSRKYVLGREEIERPLRAIEEAPLELLDKLGAKLSAGDLPKGMPMLDIVRVLALGRGVPLVGPSARRGSRVSDIGEVQALGATPTNIAAGGTSMFKTGAETGEELATLIYPNFRGTFNPQPLERKAAKSQIDLLQEVRGGIPVLRTAKVVDLSGNKLDYASKTLYNAHDHAAAKSREASTQAIEQRIADALNIKLPDEFLNARQKRLDFVNNPNENDVLVDFLANSGKGGVGLSDLPRYLAKRLDDPSLTQHQRVAYRQMLSDVLGGRYKEIEKQYRAYTNQVPDPLKNVVDSQFRRQFGDGVDVLRRQLRELDGYTEAQFALDMNILGEAVELVARRNKKVTWAAVRKQAAELGVVLN